MPVKLALPAILALAVALPAAAPAIVPPKDCGTIEVRSKTHRIKADGVTCRFAKRGAKRYLRDGTRPGTGWKCRRYARSSSFSFKCNRGTTRSIFGIKQR